MKSVKSGFSLCTFSGRFGDILWSLPTAREIAKLHEYPVSFAVMPQYASLVPLLKAQPYIADAYALEDWVCTGSPHGDQPWKPPTIPPGYDYVYHLTYRSHPMRRTLVESIAEQQSVSLEMRSWISVPKPKKRRETFTICYAFTETQKEKKKALFEFLFHNFDATCDWVDLKTHSWLEAARELKASHIFLGCRSANYVLAVGTGIPILTYEPTLERRPMLFSCPWALEMMGGVDDFRYCLDILEGAHESFRTHLGRDRRSDYDT